MTGAVSAPSPFLDLTRRVQGASLARTRYVQEIIGHLVEVVGVRTEFFAGGPVYGDHDNDPFLFRTIVTTTSWVTAAEISAHLRYQLALTSARPGDRVRRPTPAAVLTWNPVLLEQLDLRPRS